jgi:hypothetical protein
MVFVFVQITKALVKTK